MPVIPVTEIPVNEAGSLIEPTETSPNVEGAPFRRSPGARAGLSRPLRREVSQGGRVRGRVSPGETPRGIFCVTQCFFRHKEGIPVTDYAQFKCITLRCLPAGIADDLRKGR